MNLYETIMDLCEKKGITAYRMCKDAGIQPSVITDLKMGRQKSLSSANIEKIANYFGVPMEYLLNGGCAVNTTGDVSVTNGAAIIGSQRQATAHVSNGLTEIEEAIMEEVKKLSPKDKIKVYNFITELEG